MPELLKNKRTGEYGYRLESGEVIPVDVARNKKTGAMGWKPKGSDEPWQTYTPPEKETSDQSQGNQALRAAEFASRGFLDRAADVAGSIPELAASGLRAINPRLAPEAGYYPEKIKEGLQSAGKFISTPVNSAVDFGPNEPQSALERGALGAGRGVADAASFMVPGMAAAKYGSGVTQAVGRQMAAQPAMQASAGAAAGGTAEATDSELAGLAAGIATPLAPSVAQRAAAKALTPFPSQLTRQAERGREYAENIPGMELTPAQKTGSEGLRSMESTMAEIPFTAKRQGEIFDAQREAFTREALKRAGIEGSDVGEDVMQSAFQKFENDFGDLARQTTVNVDDKLLKDVDDVVKNYGRRLETNVKPVFNSYIDDLRQLRDAYQQGRNPQIPGEEYQRITSDIKRTARSTNDPALQNALYALTEKIDDAVGRSMPNTGMKEAWANVRRQYRNFVPVQKAALAGDQQSRVDATLPLGRYASEVRKMDQNSYLKGESDLSDLARAADFLAERLPNSGTARRQMMMNMLTGSLPVGVAGGGAMAGFDPAMALALGAGSVALPKGVQSVYQSAPVQAYLKNQLAPNRSQLPSKELILKILAAQEVGNATGGQ